MVGGEHPCEGPDEACNSKEQKERDDCPCQDAEHELEMSF